MMNMWYVTRILLLCLMLFTMIQKLRNDKLAALRGTYGPQAVAEVVLEVNQPNEANHTSNIQ